MSTIEKNGRITHRSRNLRGILDYARRPNIWVERVMCQKAGIECSNMPDGGISIFTKGLLTVYFSDGAVGKDYFADYSVMVSWVQSRRSWGTFMLMEV